MFYDQAIVPEDHGKSILGEEKNIFDQENKIILVYIEGFSGRLLIFMWYWIVENNFTMVFCMPQLHIIVSINFIQCKIVYMSISKKFNCANCSTDLKPLIITGWYYFQIEHRSIPLQLNLGWSYFMFFLSWNFISQFVCILFLATREFPLKIIRKQ